MLRKSGILLLLALVITSGIITLAKAQETRLKQSPADTVKLERKSPSGALFRSMLVPGWGQWYTKRHFKSVAVFLGEGALIGFMAYEWNQLEKFKDKFQSESDPVLKNFYFRSFELHEDNRNTYLWFLAGAVFVSMWDAYVDAHLYNFDQERKQLDLMGGLDKEGRVRVAISYSF